MDLAIHQTLSAEMSIESLVSLALSGIPEFQKYINSESSSIRAEISEDQTSVYIEVTVPVNFGEDTSADVSENSATKSQLDLFDENETEKSEKDETSTEQKQEASRKRIRRTKAHIELAKKAEELTGKKIDVHLSMEEVQAIIDEYEASEEPELDALQESQEEPPENPFLDDDDDDNSLLATSAEDAVSQLIEATSTAEDSNEEDTDEDDMFS